MYTLHHRSRWMIAVILSLSFELSAQWVSTNGPGGGFVFDIKSSGSDLYAGTAIGGVLRSTDNGANWTVVNTGLTNLIVQSIGVLGTDIYAGTEGSGVFRSTNSGASWTAANNGIDTKDIRAIAANGTDLYAADYGGSGVFRSTDNGSTWSTTGLTGPSKYVRALMVKGGQIFAGTGAGSGKVYRSTDDGATWIVKDPVTTSNNVRAFAVVGTDLFVGIEGYGVYRSSDDGDSWTAASSGLNLQVTSLTVDGTDLYAGTADGTGMYRSTDNGTTWSAKNLGVVNMSVVTLTRNASGVFAGIEGGGVLRTTDQGATWTAVNNGFMAAWTSSLLVNGSNLFIGTLGTGVSRSTDGGATWTVVTSGLTTGAVNALAIGGSDLYAGTSGNGAFHSTNSGSSWTAVNTGLGNLNVSALATKGTDVFAGTGGGAYRSTNAGGNWSSVSTGLTNTNVKALLVKGTDIFVGTAGGVFRSTDDGANWSSVSSFTNQDVLSLATDGTRLFAGTAAGLYRSTNNGTNWTDISTGLTNTTVNAIATDGTYLIAGTNAGASRSLDQGATWNDFSNGLPATDYRNTNCLAIDGSTIYGGMVGFGVSKTTVTSGLGQNIDLATTSNFNSRLDSEASEDFFGCAVANGDINGDGIRDVIVGAYGASHNSRSGSGSVYVIYGASGSITGTVTDLATSGNFNFRFDGPAANAYLGTAVASGDINGDGFDDVIMGAYNASPNGRTGSGSVYVVYGASDTSTGTIRDLATSTNFHLRLDGETAYSSLSQALASADVNGDGFDDVLAGAVGNAHNGRTGSGSVYVVYGASGTSTGTIRDLATSTSFNIRYDGSAEYDYVGGSVATGDINGDGRSDVIAGANNASKNSRTSSGSVYVIYGTSGSSTGDTYDLSLPANYNIRCDGAAAYDNAGFAVAGGDVNGDGFHDVILGAFAADYNGRGSSGSVYVIYGASGSSTGNLRDLAAPASFNLRYDGPAVSQGFGCAIASGDVNGDAYDDVIGGAKWAANNGRVNSGSVLVISGASGTSTGNILDLATSSNYQVLYNGAMASEYLGVSVVGGDVNGDSFADLILGANTASHNSRTNSGSVYLMCPVTSGTPAAKVRQSPSGDAPALVWATENASIDFAAGTAGTVSVQQIQTQPSTGNPSSTASVSWIVATTKSGITGTTVRLRFQDAHVAGLTKAALKMFKRSTGGGPTDWTLVDGSSVNTAANTVTGVVDGFSEFTIGDASALPVQMTRLTAEVRGQTSHVRLQWTTANEIDNAGWEVERRVVSRQYGVGSMEKDAWVKVGFVEGAGTSTSPREYEFTDAPAAAGRYVYRLKQIDRSGEHAYSGEAEIEVGLAPRKFSLGHNYPNPFNPSTTIRFTLSEDARTSLVVYDLLGREVARLLEEDLKAGILHQAVFDAHALPSGMYLVRLRSGSHAALQKILLAK